MTPHGEKEGAGKTQTFEEDLGDLPGSACRALDVIRLGSRVSATPRP